MNKYISILQKLYKYQIPYVVIGTWALKYVFPRIMFNYEVRDCDLVIADDIEKIRQTIKILQDSNWEVRVWETVVDERVEPSFLKGKYYLRATQNELTLDITYECPFIPWEEMIGKKMLRKPGISIANLNHILQLKRIKGRDVDLEIVERFDRLEEFGKQMKMKYNKHGK